MRKFDKGDWVRVVNTADNEYGIDVRYSRADSAYTLPPEGAVGWVHNLLEEELADWTRDESSDTDPDCEQYYVTFLGGYTNGRKGGYDGVFGWWLSGYDLEKWEPEDV